ncbi:MAG: tagatose 1,6-diphosphate aldolase [Armatimonadota bacterium]|nr:tagatose 1,6-diphosphate aldolase [Armatimonadota bacterium]
MTPTTPGKARGLARISDGAGRYAILAIDQRAQLLPLVTRGADAAAGAPGAALGALKRLLAEVLAGHVTGLLVDPTYGYHRVLPVLPRSVGLLLTLEDHRVETTPAGFRRSRLIPNWSVATAVRAGAEALKLLVFSHPAAPPDVARAQQALVREVGEACRVADRPFVLELLPYPLPGQAADEYARALPELSVELARTFAAPTYGVDLYKLALPGDPTHVREWGGTLYSLADLTEAMREITRLLPAPWVLLSGGMPGDRFVAAFRAALAAGARGYLAGRAVWWEAVQAYPDMERVRQALEADGVSVLRALNQALAEVPPVPVEAEWRLPVATEVVN